jgi:type II secretory pathway component PulJ
MAKTATSRPGKTEGYILLDATIALLLSALVAASALPALDAALRGAERALESSRSGIEAWNGLVAEGLDDLAP